MSLPAVRVRTGTTTVRDPQTGTAYPFLAYSSCLYGPIRWFFVNLLVVFKPVVNLAVLSYFVREKWSQIRSVFYHSGSTFSGILWRRLG